MITFEVQDMTCSHCVRSITEAVKRVDAQAQVEIDLARHRVRVDLTQADAAALGDAIRHAGYTPVMTFTPASDPAAKPASASKGGCCG